MHVKTKAVRSKILDSLTVLSGIKTDILYELEHDDLLDSDLAISMRTRVDVARECLQTIMQQLSEE